VRLHEVLKNAFGSEPVVLTDPPRDEITMEQFDAGMFTLFLAGSKEVTTPVREAFAQSGSYWLPNGRPLDRTVPAQFGATEPAPLPAIAEGTSTRVGRSASGWVQLRTATVAPAPVDLRPPTDDWPFLYSRAPGIPGLTWRGMGIMVALSIGLWLALRGRSSFGDGPSDRDLAVRSFFLGAGFMLVETKAVVHMALLFGSTWMVNSVVFAAILAMALVGNLYAGWMKPKNLTPYYVGLFASLALNLAIPLDAFLGLDRTVQVAGACLLAFAPVAFAGVIFATSFARSRNPNQVFGANVAGALVGGLAENASMVLGFRYLLVVALAFYLLSSAWGGKRAASQAE
jgi:hypothetical protein